MNKAILISVICIIAFSSFIWGFSSGVYHYFPFDLINNQKRLVIGCYDPNEHPHVFETNVDSLIKIQDELDIQEKRKKLINSIWKNDSFPKDNIPNMVEKNIEDERYLGMNNLQSIDKITIVMDYGINSIAYIFKPEKSNSELMIYHQGHHGDFHLGKKTIEYFLDKEYTVVAFAMPLYGMNNNPIIELDHYGKIKFEVHNQFHLLDNQEFSSIKFFLEPIIISLNYIDEEFLLDSYSMIGVSGGGWTTIVYSAIDDRISNNFAITGMYPAYLHQLYHPSDYERIISQLYENANVIELFVMSAYGEERKAVQIFNKYDPGGRCGDFYKTYEESVKNRIEKLGKGEFLVILDDTHNEHKISEHALSIVQNHLEN